MPDLYMDVDTALSEVPVNLLPLLDDTDFKTIKDAVAYNAAGMALFWHFVTSAGAYTVTAVTPTTAGNYDWTDQGTAGIYTIEIPASGGASINNDTEGYGWFTGNATGVLPWRGPVIGFRAAAINDSLCDAGTTGLLSPTVAARTLDVSAGGEAGMDWANVGTPNSTVSLSATTVSTVTTLTGHTAQTGDCFARLGAPAGASVSADVAAVKADTAATLLDTGTDGVVVASGSKTGYTLTATTGLGNQTASITGNLSGSVGSVTGAVGSVTGNVGGNVTGEVGSVGTAGISSASLAASALNAIADGILDRNMATGTDSGTNSTAVRTPRQAVRALRNKVTVSGGTATVTKEDDVTTSWTAAVTTAAGDPTTGVDPT